MAPTGNVENDRSVSDINYLKDDKRNSLGEDHLNDSMRGWRCRFTVNDFPYEAALGAWKADGQHVTFCFCFPPCLGLECSAQQPRTLCRVIGTWLCLAHCATVTPSRHPETEGTPPQHKTVGG